MKEESDTLTKNISPFVLDLPKDNIKYHEILGQCQSVSMKSGLVCLKPGENVGIHTTGNRDELLVILNGSGEVELEGCSNKKINERSVAYIPPFTKHNVFNTGDEFLRYIYIVSLIEYKE